MAEDTQPMGPDPEREALIEEMVRDAKTIELPTESDKEDPVLHRGDESLPVPMVKQKVSSAGYVYLWDTRTHVKVPILYYMLSAKMRQRRQDGSFQFTANEPKEKPKRGEHMCMLHPRADNRAHYDALGFRACPKDNLTNPYQVRRHMERKHPAEWNAIEEERKERERQEDRQLQRAIVERVSPKEIPQEVVSTEATVNKGTAEYICNVCDADFGSQKTLDRHKADKHT